MKIAVVADSTAYIPKDLKEKYNIYTIPLIVNMDDGSYKEEIEITTAEFFEKMAAMNELPTTSQPSIGDYILLLEQLRNEGYTDVISVHLSAEISGTCANARAAGASVDGINLHVVDTEIACLMQGFMALYAAQNKDKLELVELLENLEEMKQKTSSDAKFIVDSMKNLQKGGRVSHSQALIGGLLNIKPVLEFQEGKIVPYEKVRTMKKAKSLVEEQFGEEIKKQAGKKITATVIHSNDEEAGREWMRHLQSLYPDVHFTLSYFGPVIATHLGEGSLGLGYTTFDLEM
ncbi:DegV family protein [Aliicoccus persicus]|uniref:EDD domain protein, DegV family n=1 Tax=Aliicoccus persicus TaxID=930138 RepID=A0A662Z351_9STAP|nr:DegV family protein [Aliicoccus persicus]SEW00391.1 EDD domain protein, DegV family [Aliicoccus persicus]